MVLGTRRGREDGENAEILKIRRKAGWREVFTSFILCTVNRSQARIHFCSLASFQVFWVDSYKYSWLYLL